MSGDAALDAKQNGGGRSRERTMLCIETQLKWERNGKICKKRPAGTS